MRSGLNVTHTSRITCTALALIVGATTSIADGFRNPPESAQGIGNIGGRIAYVDGVTAVTLNPANIADADTAKAGITLTVGDATKSFTGPTGVADDTRDGTAVLPAIHGIMPLSDSDWVAGIGIYPAFGRSAKYRSDASFAASSPSEATLGVINLNPTLATRLSESVRIGVGVSAYFSELSFDQAGASAESDGTGYGANAAVSWECPDNGHVIAFIVRSPFDIDYDGDVTIDAAGLESEFDTEIKFPTIVGLAGGFQVSDSVRVELNLEWLEHSRNESLPVSIDDPTFPFPSVDLPQAWEDNWKYGLGVHWTLESGWVLRAGYLYQETPTPQATTIPTAAEQDGSIVSIGLGFSGDNYDFDAGYAVGIFNDRTVSSSPDPAINGEYEFDSQLLSVAYTRHL